MNDPVLTTKEAAEKLRLHEETVKRYLRKGRLKGYVFSDKSGWRVYVSSVDDFIRAHQNTPTAANETTTTETKK